MNASVASSNPELADLVDQIASWRRQAIAAGARPPGRYTIQRRTGASSHQARIALAIVAARETASTARSGARSASVVAFPDQGESTMPMDLAELADLAPAGHQPEQPIPDAGIRPQGSPYPYPYPGRWPLIVIAFGAAVAVWSGWVGLGELTGFGEINPLPGIVKGWTINTAITLPLGVESYAAYALRVWLSPAPLSTRTRRYARASSITSLATGIGAQAAYHLMTAHHLATAPDWITTLVSSVPVALVGLAAALASLVSADRQLAPTAQSEGPSAPAASARLTPAGAPATPD